MTQGTVEQSICSTVPSRSWRRHAQSAASTSRNRAANSAV
jgi:hypothetical protein